MRQLFPYIGGKYTVAPEINRRFGAIDTRIDAFTGSSSWILASEPVRYEIVNDLDGYVVNYLRAIKYAPEEVARHLDFPRAELELIAYHHYTRDKLPELVARLGGDPDYYDPVIAARWAYVMAYKLDPSLLKPGGWLTRDGRLVYERGEGRKRGSMTATPLLLARLVRERRVSEYVAALSERLHNVQAFWNDFEVVAAKAHRPELGVVGILLDPPYPAPFAGFRLRHRRRRCLASRRALGGRSRRQPETAHRGLRVQRRRERRAVPAGLGAVRLESQRHRTV
jgi:hypothetical protein